MAYPLYVRLNVESRTRLKVFDRMDMCNRVKNIVYLGKSIVS